MNVPKKPFSPYEPRKPDKYLPAPNKVFVIEENSTLADLINAAHGVDPREIRFYIAEDCNYAEMYWKNTDESLIDPDYERKIKNYDKLMAKYDEDRKLYDKEYEKYLKEYKEYLVWYHENALKKLKK